MQDLSKIEQEHLQANDRGDDAPTVGISREFAEQFKKTLWMHIRGAATKHFEDSGMAVLLTKEELKECFGLMHDHISDAIGDMPIWDIVKRGEA